MGTPFDSPQVKTFFASATINGIDTPYAEGESPSFLCGPLLRTVKQPAWMLMSKIGLLNANDSLESHPPAGLSFYQPHPASSSFVFLPADW
jgi:hypothetical protein